MIEVKHLTKTFKLKKKQPGLWGTVRGLFSGEYEAKCAVEDISFAIRRGEMVGYIGANGAGKSTTIKIMTGILAPSSGSCTVNGTVPYENRQQNARNIGVVFGQRTQLWWDLQLSETFSILKEIYNVPAKAYRDTMEFLDSVLDLHEFMTNPVRTLSLGQRMRADLAAALLHRPAVVFLDEPTIGLDVLVKEKMRQAIKEINQTFGATVVLTTHDLSDIEELCPRIIMIDHGRLVYDGSLQNIKDRYGAMKMLKFEVKEAGEARKIRLSTAGLAEQDLKSWCEGHSYFVSFNRHKLGIAEIVAQVMAQAEVLDISIAETGIEDIVKGIYRNELAL